MYLGLLSYHICGKPTFAAFIRAIRVRSVNKAVRHLRYARVYPESLCNDFCYRAFGVSISAYYRVEYCIWVKHYHKGDERELCNVCGGSTENGR